MKKIFYYITTFTILAYLIDTLIFFNINLEMRISLSLVVYSMAILGFILGIFKKNIGRGLLFFAIEIITILINLVYKKTENIFYITKEVLKIELPISRVKVVVLIAFVIINLINIYIIYKNRRKINEKKTNDSSASISSCLCGSLPRCTDNKE